MTRLLVLLLLVVGLGGCDDGNWMKAREVCFRGTYWIPGLSSRPPVQILDANGKPIPCEATK